MLKRIYQCENFDKKCRTQKDSDGSINYGVMLALFGKFYLYEKGLILANENHECQNSCCTFVLPWGGLSVFMTGDTKCGI